MEQNVKGIFLKSIVKKVKEKKGESGLEQLGSLCGDCNYSGFKNYPMEQYIALTSFACKIIYGADTDEAQYEFGKLSFDVYGESILGKTMFSLLGRDIKKILLSLASILESVTPGLVVEVENLGGNCVRVVMRNNPQHIRHYEGIIARGMEYFGKQYKIECREIEAHSYEYLITWS